MVEKIIFLLNSPYPYYTGGRETWLNNVANLLADRYEVVVIAEDRVKKNASANRWTIDPRIKLINVKSFLSYRFTNWFLRWYFEYFHCFFGAEMMRRALFKQIKKDQKTFAFSSSMLYNIK